MVKSPSARAVPAVRTEPRITEAARCLISMAGLYAFGRRQTREKAHGLRGPMGSVRDHYGLLPASLGLWPFFLYFQLFLGGFWSRLGVARRCVATCFLTRRRSSSETN